MTLYFEESGPKNSETLIFLHGDGAGAWMWRKPVQHLADFHCLVPDLPEHDHSAAIKPFSMNAAALAVAELIRQHALCALQSVHNSLPGDIIPFQPAWHY